MVERRGLAQALVHACLLGGIVVVAFPVWIMFVVATLSPEQALQVPVPLLPGSHLFDNLATVLGHGARPFAQPVAQMLTNSLIVALVIAIGKIAISILSAFALVYFRFRFRGLLFALIFVTLMLPVEVRIMPSYQVVASLGLVDTYAGLTLPLIASATATFLFRQFYLTVPDELLEAARIDGAGPMRFFWSILLPLSRTSIAALFVIQFIYGWNQYLWPLLMTTQASMNTAVVGIRLLIAGGDAATDWNLVMAMAMLAMIPPVIVVISMQRWFVRGLIESEK